MKTAAFVLAALVLAFGADALAQGKPHVDPKSIKLKQPEQSSKPTQSKQSSKTAAKSTAKATAKAQSKKSAPLSSLMPTNAQLVDLVKTLAVAAQPQPVAAAVAAAPVVAAPVAAAPVVAVSPAPALRPIAQLPARAAQPIVHVKTPAEMAAPAVPELTRYKNDDYGVSVAPPPGFVPYASPNASLLFASSSGDILEVAKQQMDRDGFRAECRSMGKFELWKDVDTDLCLFASSNGAIGAMEWMPSGHVVAGMSGHIEAKTLAKLVATFASTFQAEAMEPGATFDR